MKEVRIKLDDDKYQKLMEVAKKELRSITNLVTVFILRGIKEDREHQEREAVRE